jgi:hypothetical protein
VTLLRAPEIEAAWERPSALPEMTVGGLAGHLAHQILSASEAVRACLDPGQPGTGEAGEAGEVPISLLDHYARAAWIDAPLDGEVNSGIRARGESIGAQGPGQLAERVGASFAEQPGMLARCAPDQPVFMPQVGRALRLEDFLLTRTMELAVHLDDLTVSVGLPSQELPDSAFDPVLVLLARLAGQRHGQAALLRALTRTERAPAAINAI